MMRRAFLTHFLFFFLLRNSPSRGAKCKESTCSCFLCDTLSLLKKLCDSKEELSVRDSVLKDKKKWKKEKSLLLVVPYSHSLP